MNQQWINQLFMLGYNQTVIIDKISIMRTDESLFIHLGNRFASEQKPRPKYLFLDNENVIIVSEDMKKTYGVFVLEETLILIDEDGQFCKVRNYPNAPVHRLESSRNGLKLIKNHSELVS